MFAELVCGPPGSGKTTYVEGKRQFLDAHSVMDPRIVVTVNLDPANDGVFPYPCDVDIGGLIEHAQVMQQEHLGPNGGYLFCVEYLSKHTDWLCREMEAAVLAKGRNAVPDASRDLPVWFIIDCPGQVEFYIHSEGLAAVVKALHKVLRANVVMTHLCDGIIATRDVPTYVSTCLLCLTCMTDLELPHVNVLTKWDAVQADNVDDEAESFLETGVFVDEHFTRLWKRDENRATSALRREWTSRGMAAPAAAPTHTAEGNPSEPRLKRLSRAVMEVVDGYGLVGFEALNVQSEEMMRSVCDRVDMAAGLIR